MTSYRRSSQQAGVQLVSYKFVRNGVFFCVCFLNRLFILFSHKRSSMRDIMAWGPN